MADLIKNGGERLWRQIHKLILHIWEQEEMPKDWKLGIILPIHKKGDKTNCSNYRGITLLSVPYKILSGVIHNRMTPYSEEILGEYQCGFRKNRSTTDHLCTLRQIQEKCYEYNIDIYYLFIDFKQAFDKVHRKKMLQSLTLLGIPRKLVKMVEVTMAESTAAIRSTTAAQRRI